MNFVAVSKRGYIKVKQKIIIECKKITSKIKKELAREKIANKIKTNNTKKFQQTVLNIHAHTIKIIQTSKYNTNMNPYDITPGS